ncbi:HAD family hydrolase [uncultured Sanguibacteroides sp.]|uniref:HAD family hydrolase n=1 Tax=uncultured Sanguibacteroides sp. TaxID=1635151 RepID=UPI0025F02A81|nr:HAD family hydrolase [uncultured Sanguibacteroides sp.]
MKNAVSQKNYTYILLDLDGTVTDSMPGITRSVQYALSCFDIQVTDINTLQKFVGPPLKESFMEYYHFSEKMAMKAIEAYRKRFEKIGIYENSVYPSIESLLKELNKAKKKVMLATSKPEIYARQILDYFHLTPYFTFIGGSSLDGSISQKDQVIHLVLERNKINDKNKAVMVGDRKHDIEGAKKTGLDSVGVLYGYGDRQELSLAGANYIVQDIKELSYLLLNER